MKTPIGKMQSGFKTKTQFDSIGLARLFVAALEAQNMRHNLYHGSSHFVVQHDEIPQAPKLPDPTTEKSLAMLGDGAPVF